MSDYRSRLFLNYHDTQVSFNDKDDSWFADWFFDYALVNYLPRIVSKRPLSELKILEIGCNKGFLLAALHRFGFLQLHGIDLSPADLEVAKKLVPDALLECIDASDFLRSRSGEFDVVILKAVLEHVEKQTQMVFLEAIEKSLSDNGVVIIDVPNMDWFFASHERYMDFTHEVGFTQQSLGQVMRNVFGDVNIGRAVWPRAGSLLGRISGMVRPIIEFFVNIFLRVMGEGAGEVWWSNRSIIGTGRRKSS